MSRGREVVERRDSYLPFGLLLSLTGKRRGLALNGRARFFKSVVLSMVLSLADADGLFLGSSSSPSRISSARLLRSESDFRDVSRCFNVRTDALSSHTWLSASRNQLRRMPRHPRLPS